MTRPSCRPARSTPAPDFVAVLDDDEYPDPNWLTEMIRVALQYDVEIVGGPVFPVFDAPDHWLAKSGLYAPYRYATGPVSMIYGAGNMLIRRTTLEHYLDEPFLHDYAFTGGSDEEFFFRCRRDGRSFRVGRRGACVRDDAAVANHRRLFAAADVPQGHRRHPRRTQVRRTAIGAMRRWCKGLGLIGSGAFFCRSPRSAAGRAIMRSLILAARGSGRIAAEFGILLRGIPIAPCSRSNHRTRTAAHCPGRVAGMASRFIARQSRSKVLSLENVPPMVTFTFDDVPASACELGAQHPRAPRRPRNVLTSPAAVAAQRTRTDRCARRSIKLRTVWANGHEIGCHTYSHPAIRRMSLDELGLELDAQSGRP